MKSKLLGKWSRAKRMIKHRFVPHALILMYHRVTELDNDPHLLAVSPENFASHLKIIRNLSSPIPLREFTRALQEGRVPKRAVVVTFDDGYADNLLQAKPLLEQFDVPATVFVTAGQLESRLEFWWDELDRVLLQPGILPSNLQLEIKGNLYKWDLNGSAEYTRANYLRDRDWHIEREDEPTVRHAIFQKLFKLMYYLSAVEKQEVLGNLRQWAWLEATHRPMYRVMNRHELSQLYEPGLIEIGAHTMTHPVLGALSPADQRLEIRQSKERLETILNSPVKSFASPHGSNNEETIAILKDSDFVCACTSQTELVWSNASVYQLPRVGVRDMDGGTFERWFKWWMNG